MNRWGDSELGYQVPVDELGLYRWDAATRAPVVKEQ